MTQTKKWLTTAAVLTLSATLATAAPHQGRGGKHGGRGGDFSERFAQKLNLTDAQKQQIEASQKSFREQNRAFFDAAAATRRQIREAKEAGDTARLESLKATAKSQHAQMKQLRQEQRARVAAFLTPEQRAQLDAMKAEHEGKRGGRRNRN
jgi:Spy/CpxP family protein refolding chaperone